MKSAKDMTEGSPFVLLIGFAFSLMVGNVFQQLRHYFCGGIYGGE